MSIQSVVLPHWPTEWLAARGRNESFRSIAKRYGVSAALIHKVLKRLKSGDKVSPSRPSGAERELIESADGTATLTFHTDSPIKTQEDAIKAAGVDLTVWFVDRCEISAWTVPMKVEQGQDQAGKWKAAKPIQTQQYGIKLHLRRIVARAIRDAMELVFERLKESAPRWPAITSRQTANGEPFLAVFGLFDIHFGKLCWEPETGNNYDLKIAESVLRNAVVDLIAQNAHRKVAKILLPFGNDWLHIDSRTNTTTRGTPQDVDGRFSKVFATAKLAALWAVETMATLAPVQVELVPGNHDRTLAECLCHIIDARFHRSDRVTVGLDPKSRKYVRYGTNLIGLAHGDLVKPDKLPGLMPAEAKADWAETTCHEWLTGHGHVSKKWTTLDTDTQAGTVVRQLRALTRTDLWHFDSGYIGGSPGAEVYFYGRDSGYAGHAVVPAR